MTTTDDRPATDPHAALDPRALRHPDSAKWTYYPEDVLPLWVADMDFPIAPSIRQALVDRLDVGVGYAQMRGDPRLNALLRAKFETQGLTDLPENGWIGYLPGVVTGLYAAVLGLTSPGDEVITFTPVYPPFLTSITDHGRVARQVPLAQSDAGWQIDWDALEAAVTSAARLLMLCHPHNPVGRVWTEGELSRLADFALRHRLWVVSDELHADLSFVGPHRAFAGLNPEIAARTVTLTGPCKAYNTAGLGIGAMVSHDPALIARLQKASAGVMGHPGALSISMWIAALQDDGAWLRETLAYLQANRDFLADFVRSRLPEVRFTPPEATYLAWLDFRAHPQAERIQQVLLEEAKVALNDGPPFGAGSQGFVRLNFATGRNILGEALERVARVVG